MNIVIKSGSSTDEVEVRGDGNVMVNITDDVAASGYVMVASELDSGSITGTRILRQANSSQDFRRTGGVDSILWNDSYNHGQFNSSKYKGGLSGQTFGFTNGSLIFNASASTTLGHYSTVSTYRTFPLYMNAPTYVAFTVMFSGSLQNNSVMEFGVGHAVSAVTPTDGVYFRASGSSIHAVINYNSNESWAYNVFSPVSGEFNDYLIAITEDHAEFWVNDTLRASVSRPATTGGTVMSNSVPLLMRSYNTGTVSSPVQMAITNACIATGDIKRSKPWVQTMVSLGQSSISNFDGQQPGMSANFANSAAPSTITNLSNSANTQSITLGGQFQFGQIAGSETDLIVFCYANPTGSTTSPAKNFMVTGVDISSYNMGDTNGVAPIVLMWSIGVGGTSVDLTTPDSDTSGSRSARRLCLGVQTIAGSAPIGANCNRVISSQFAAPLLVEQGTYLHIILKLPVCTMTVAQIIRGTIAVNGYFY